jgi:hypothetical protein
MLEQIVPMKNIKHGWANIAAWASVRRHISVSSQERIPGAIDAAPSHVPCSDDGLTQYFSPCIIPSGGSD